MGPNPFVERILSVARIVDELERNGIVGPADGATAREFLIESEGWQDAYQDFAR